MSKRPGRRNSLRGKAVSAGDSLARLLDTPHPARIVRSLAPETLHQLIRRCGLDVCAEVVALATPAQLASVLDLELWHSDRAGQDERFDVERFGEWLELLVDAGDAVAARTVAAMDEHLVVAGLSRYIRVFDPAAIVTTFEGEPLDIDARAQGAPECLVGGYLVRGINSGAWDAIVALLLALEAEHHERLHAVMRGCRRLSSSTPEVDGLDDLLMAPEQLLHDAALDRERRRSEQGYNTPADARAFLQMARRPRPSHAAASVRPLVAAYFRATRETVTPEDEAAHDLPPQGDEARDAIGDLLHRSGLVPERPRALLDGATAEPSRLARLRMLIEYVRDNDESLYLARQHELAFLANTLVAGCSIQSRSFTPQEASDAAVAICNLGLEHWPARWPDPVASSTPPLHALLPGTFLMHHDLVSAFEVGWMVLHEDVGMFATGQLILTLSDLRCGDAEIQKGLTALRIALRRQRDADTPWRARDALDAIAMLDMPAWVCLRGLLDECPLMPEALTASLERRTGAISATAFEFISTADQLVLVRQFMERLPDLLRR